MHEDSGECPEGWTKIGGGETGVFGAPHAPTRGRAGRKTIYYMTMTRDRPKFWNGRSALAVKSYHPETLAAEQ